MNSMIFMREDGEKIIELFYKMRQFFESYVFIYLGGIVDIKKKKLK